MKKRRKRRAESFPLKEVLAARGWSQNKLSRASGMSMSNVNGLATGKRAPNWQTILRIATTIGADLGDFHPGKHDELKAPPRRTHRRAESEELQPA